MQATEAREPVTARLVDKVAGLDGHTDGAIAALVKDCVIDWLGVTILGAREAPSEALLDELREQSGHVQAGVIGANGGLPTHHAAMFNGAASHMLDYDDVNFAVLGHASAPVLAAVLALAQWRGLGGAAVMDAFLTGYETSCRVGLLVAPGHYNRGFHATGTIGSFGAAAASARLLGLDPLMTAHAFGIAATRSAGLKGMFGTPCKPLHVGMAAETGVFAAKMAARGFESRPDALEAAQGFAVTHSPDYNPAAALADPERKLHLFNNLFKLHCACYETQATIECGLDARRLDLPSSQAVRAVRLRVNEHCNEICNIFEPLTGMETKFSLRAMAAFSLAGVDTSRPDVFSDANARDPALIALRDKVAVDLVADMPLTRTEMEVELASGEVLRTTYDSGAPIADAALRTARVVGKFNALITPILGVDRCAEIVDFVASLEHQSDLGGLVRLTQR